MEYLKFLFPQYWKRNESQRFQTSKIYMLEAWKKEKRNGILQNGEYFISNLWLAYEKASSCSRT